MKIYKAILGVGIAVCTAVFIFVAGFAVPVATAGELTFVENDIIYFSRSGSSLIQDTSVVNKGRILTHNTMARKLLYVTPQSTQGTDILTGGSLMLMDLDSLEEQLVSTNVISANLSSDGTRVVLWNVDHEIYLTDSSGVVLKRIGVYGAAPIFSHDGSLITYLKLANVSPDGDSQSLFEHAQGIAVYDMKTSREVLVTNGGSDDFAPVGFSLSMTKLYFNSTRPFAGSSQNHVASLWVVDLESEKVERLTNTDEDMVKQGLVVPTVNENALWSLDRKTIITSNGKEQGIWLFSLDPLGGISEAVHIADGESPQWLLYEKSIIFRGTSNGKSVWHIQNVR